MRHYHPYSYECSTYSGTIVRCNPIYHEPTEFQRQVTITGSIICVLGILICIYKLIKNA